MLAKFVGLFGFDLNRQIQLLKERVEDFSRETTDKIKGEAKEIGLMIALAAAGGIMALITFVIFLMAIYRWIAATAGPLAGYIVVGSITTALAIVLLVLASSRGKSKLKVHDRTERLVHEEEKVASSSPPPRTQETYPSGPGIGIPLAFGDLHPPLSGAVREFFSNAPRTGTAIDSVINQVIHEASTASGETVNVAADIVRTGSRKAVLGVLASSFLLGLFLARRVGSPYSAEGLSSSANKGPSEFTQS
jgi:hypothetical protein